jgi:putative transposase
MPKNCHGRDASVCVERLEDALRKHGWQRCSTATRSAQFTSKAFTGVLKREGIAISMDGRGRAMDNIFVERRWP